LKRLKDEEREKFKRIEEKNKKHKYKKTNFKSITNREVVSLD